MSKKDEALKLALEALNELIPDVHDWYGAKVHRANAAITAIREALAENTSAERVDETVKSVHEQPAQQQEPVAWATRMGEYAHIHWGAKRPEYPMVYEVPLYTSPQPAQPQQEPVAWMVMNGVCKYQLLGEKHQADALCAEMQKRHALSGSLAAFHVRPLVYGDTPPAQQQEPVAWLHTKIEGVAVPHRPADLDKHPDRWTALYPEPKPCPTCEALARTVMMDQTAHDKQRKPLTDEQIMEMYNEPRSDAEMIAFARAIEAKLNEKNA